jgi:hypothetical protein
MGYSVHFFALHAADFGQQMVAAPQQIAERVAQRLRDQQCFTDREVQSTADKAALICQGELPRRCNSKFFDALAWIGEELGERIDVSSYQGFRRMSFLEEVGIWPWLLESRPSFAVPRCPEPPPQVGFLTAADMAKILDSGFAQLDPSVSKEALYAREEFKDILESLVEDQLDLLAILT